MVPSIATVIRTALLFAKWCRKKAGQDSLKQFRRVS